MYLLPSSEYLDLKEAAKLKCISWLNCLFLIAILISGCGSAHPTTMLVQIETKTAAPLDKQPTLTVQPKQTTIPLTSSPTILPTPTSTIPPIPTATLPPTLEPEQVEEAIKAFLRDGGNCETPCFLGIFPGKSTLGEVKDILNHLSLTIKQTTYEGKDIYGTRYDFNNSLSISGNLTIQNEIVQNIRIDITPENTKGVSQHDWIAFSPDTLIGRYGPPTRVSLALDWGPRPYFEMNIYFDAVDLIVEYSGYDLIPRQKSSPLICPLSTSFDIVRIWMGKDPIYPPLEAAPLEKATLMTLEEFSKLMTGNPDQACFIVNSDVSP